MTAPLLLLILDGLGIAPAGPENAITQANTPTLDALLQKPWVPLCTSGQSVGLPDGQMGNSEVGHLTIGAGKAIAQDLVRIEAGLSQATLESLPALATFLTELSERQGTLHLMGLCSDGGVHSHLSHLTALLELITQHFPALPIALHCITDGRDTAPSSAKAFLSALERHVAPQPMIRIQSVSGRYYAMDRDKRFERTAQAFDAMVHGKGFTAETAEVAIEAAYQRGETDEFIQPTVIGSAKPFEAIDGVLAFNFRSDRMRQICHALAASTFEAFDRQGLSPVSLLTMTPYDETLAVPAIFGPKPVAITLGEVLASHGLTQLRMAETEKYAHVTYFLNGGREAPFENESRILIPSPKVTTYDLQPEMSLPKLTETLLSAIEAGAHEVMVVNIANPDMVGHTGNLAAAITAMEAVDESLEKIVQALSQVNGQLVLTSDHGNVECMQDADGNAVTTHTLNPVPLIYSGPLPTHFSVSEGTLADIAPTVLHLLNLPIPAEMNGVPLLKRACS